MRVQTDFELGEGSQADLDSIYARMSKDFLAQELKTKAQLKHLMSNGAYKLYLARHKAPNHGAATCTNTERSSPTDDAPLPDDWILGYAFVFEPPSPRIAWLDYLAIDPQFRGTGFGTWFVDALCERMKSSRVGIMLEVEPATSADEAIRANQHRRINFYRRLGARQLDVEYLFPVEGAPYPMVLFFRPIASMTMLPKAHIQEMIQAAYGYIHADVKSRDAILQRFIGNVRDTAL